MFLKKKNERDLMSALILLDGERERVQVNALNAGKYV